MSYIHKLLLLCPAALVVVFVPSCATNAIAADLLTVQMPSFVTVHEPVIVKVTITNPLTVPITVDTGLNGQEAYQFTIAQPDGTRVEPVLSQSGFGTPGVIRLEPRQSVTKELVLGQWYTFNTSGSFIVGLTLKAPFITDQGQVIQPPSPVLLPLDVGSRDVSKLAAICASLVKQVQTAASYDDRALAAVALSYISDSVAVPYLEQISGGDLYGAAIAGLERIGDETAKAAPLRMTLGSNTDLTLQVQAALNRVSNQSTCASDASSKVQVLRSGYRFVNATRRFVQTVTVANHSTETVRGPLAFVLDGLDARTPLSYTSSYLTGCAEPLGASFVFMPLGGTQSLPAGASTTFILEFDNPDKVGIVYTPRILAGC